MKEDTQPNEALGKSKATQVVPIIRASRPPERPKWHPGYKQYHCGGFASRQYQRQRPALSQPRYNLDDREGSYGSQRSQNMPFTIPPSDYATSCVPSLYHDDKSRNHATPRNPVVHPFSTPYYPSRESHKYGWLSSEPPWSRPPRIWGETFEHNPPTSRPPKTRKKGDRHRYDEMVVDLPPMCRMGALRKAHHQAAFLAELRDQLKRTINLEIVQHRFTDTQLVITYRTPDVSQGSVSEEAPVRLFGNSGRGTDSSVVSSPELDLFPKVASGSNIKLEDICNYPPLLQVDGERSPSSTASPHARRVDYLGDITSENVIAPRQMFGNPRSFRSGVVALLYSPEGSRVESNIVREGDVPFEPEVIEIDDTPPQSPKSERTSEAANAVTSYDEVMPQGARGPSHNTGNNLSNPGGRLGIWLKEDTCTIAQVPRTSGDRMRRIITRDSKDLGYCITMHGFVHEIGLRSKSHIRPIYAPFDQEKESVEDACLFPAPFDNVVAVAEANEETALSLLYTDIESDRRVTRIPRTSTDHGRLRRGVSAVTTLPNSESSLSFVSAGYDHVVHLWSLDPSTISEEPPVPEVLDIHHSSLIQSLLSVGHRLISGAADNSIRIWDLQAAETLSTIRTSNSVYQLHLTNNPDVVFAEVAHRDLQFELHDCRLPMEGQPPLRFGYHSTQGTHGRYSRGAVDPHAWTTFASGGRDGLVRLWDLRNIKQRKQEVLCLPGQKIVHAAFTESSLIAASDDNRLSFFDFMQI